MDPISTLPAANSFLPIEKSPADKRVVDTRVETGSDASGTDIDDVNSTARQVELKTSVPVEALNELVKQLETPGPDSLSDEEKSVIRASIQADFGLPPGDQLIDTLA